MNNHGRLIDSISKFKDGLYLKKNIYIKKKLCSPKNKNGSRKQKVIKHICFASFPNTPKIG